MCWGREGVWHGRGVAWQGRGRTMEEAWDRGGAGGEHRSCSRTNDLGSCLAIYEAYPGPAVIYKSLGSNA